MANALIKYETIDAEQIARIMQGKDPGPPESWNDGNAGRPPVTPARPAGGGVIAPPPPTPTPATRPASQV